MRSLSGVALAFWCGCGALAHAQQRDQEEAPDLDFLEYLGTWAEEDDEWLAIETWERDVGGRADEDEQPKEPESDDDDEDE
jgi:hypothetical protein